MGQHGKWEFRSRFRTNAFGWKGSAPAIKRIGEAVKEIRKTKDPILRAEGAILLFERLWPTLQRIDSSSGSLGTATNKAVHELVQFIIDAPCNDQVRAKWLEKLWQAMEDDGVDYLSEVGERWGELCVSRTVASRWADELRSTLELSWERGGYFRGGPACLSCMLKAQRYDELLQLIDQAPYLSWFYRKYGVRALAASGRTEEAIQYAEASKGLNDGYSAIASACETILLDAGQHEEAYRRFALSATVATTNLARFRALVKKYPQKDSGQILQDLIASTPGEEGMWFATAKSLAYFELATSLAYESPVNIETLNRAARDFIEKNPAFALNVALASLKWLAAGQYYEITGLDVYNSVRFALDASDRVGCREEAIQRIQFLVDTPHADDFVRKQILASLNRLRISG
jgi:tetratricopeptide (TPR) repeat protein